MVRHEQDRWPLANPGRPLQHGTLLFGRDVPGQQQSIALGINHLQDAGVFVPSALLRERRAIKVLFDPWG